MRILSILLLFSQTSLGMATPKWWCSATIFGAGNPHYFLLYGRDSWEGDGTLRCTSLAESKEQPVRFGFYSKTTGFGANGSCEVPFTITFWTDKDLESLKLFATLPGLIDGSIMHWQGHVTGVELTVSAWTQSSQAIADSLAIGTFDLRAVETAK